MSFARRDYFTVQQHHPGAQLYISKPYRSMARNGVLTVGLSRRIDAPDGRFDGVAGCLRTPRGGSGKQIVVAIDRGSLRMRWMSPREYARLQGAPTFPLAANTIQNLFGFGDAVCVPVIQWIDEHVLSPVFAGAGAGGGGVSTTGTGTHRGRQPDARTAPQDHAGGEGQEHVA